MTRLSWGTPGSRLYEAGVDRGVVYFPNIEPVVWNGLVSVKEAPSESDSSTNYYDGISYAARHTPGSYAATIEAYTYPDLLDEGKPFNMTYRTQIGNDLDGMDYAYRIHLVFNARATPSEKQYTSLDDSNNGGTFVWNITSRPAVIQENQSSAHLIVDTRLAYSWTVQALEDLIYGTDGDSARLTSPKDILDLFDANSILKITDHGDGTWTAEGPDDVVSMIDSTTFQINWPSVVFIDNDTYTVSSL